jgi:hypothetical protein
MTPNGRSPWEVVFFEAVRQQLRVWAQRAIALGLRDQYAAELWTMVARLESDPESWGDPLFRFHHLGLLNYRARTAFFYVAYSVDAGRRIVYVSQVAAAPGGGLDTPGEQSSS